MLDIKHIVDSEIMIASENIYKKISELLNCTNSNDHPVIKNQLSDITICSSHIISETSTNQKLSNIVFCKQLLDHSNFNQYKYPSTKNDFKILFEKYSVDDLLSIDIFVNDLKNKNLLLRVSCIVGDLQVCKYLVENGADLYDSGAVYLSAENGYYDIIKFLFEQDIGELDKIDAINRSAIYGHTDIVKYIVGTGVNIVNSNALLFSVHNNQFETLKYIVEKYSELDQEIPDYVISNQDTDINRFLFLHVKQSQHHLFNSNIVKMNTCI